MDSSTFITVSVRIRRKQGWQDFQVTLPRSAYVLDALEEIEKQDPSLLFRHACHHASCGSCGLRVNGRERLSCVTPLADAARPGRPLRLEPLRNFPIIGDLLVDFSPFMASLDRADMPLVRLAESHPAAGQRYTRFENCIECGLCLSACPIAGSDAQYAGPAALAAAWRSLEEPRQSSRRDWIALVDGEKGVWRCHAAFECTEVCPSNVDPAGAIMSLRRFLLSGWQR
jgi:succinate dehydrogenase / fumarate reductase, iron-sulfur subunit